MKKFLTTLMMLAMLAVMMPLAANAQTRTTRRSRNYNQGRTYTTRTYTPQVYRRPSLYQRHRNLINVGIGTGAGALLGGLIGGGKGALIGTAIGAGGSALYTYKINPKTGRRYRVYR